MEDGLKRLHVRLLDMLVELRKFANENDIKFFLVGGSALGAWRHQGFIPWDDDVDIAMMRTDFEKMEKAMKKAGNHLGEYIYSPVEEQLMPDAPIGYLYDGKNIDKGYNLTAKIDIHPIDGVPDNSFLRKIQNIASKVYYVSVYRLPAKNKGKMAAVITGAIVKITPGFVFKFYRRITKKIITSWDDRTSKNICSLFGVAGYSTETMPRDYLMPLKESLFENEYFYIPGNIEPYLERLYGDFKSLPPECEQHPRHKIHLNY